MKRIGLFLLLILPLVFAPCVGGQTAQIGALPVTLGGGLAAPAVTCFALGMNSPNTTIPMNTTGATALVFATAVYSGGGVTAVSVSDNKGNGTARALTPYMGTTLGSQISYYLSPAVGLGHTFTVTAMGSATYAASFCVYRLTGATALDEGTDSGAFNQASTCKPGSINPGAGAHIVISTVGQAAAITPTVDSGLTVGGSTLMVYGDRVGIGAGYISQSSGVAINPNWTSTGDATTSCAIASFH